MKQYKKDFPILSSGKLTYLDSASTSQKPFAVLNAVREYYETYNANIHRGLYKIAEQATAKVEEVREKVAKFINAASKEEIIFTYGTTHGINLVMYALGKKNIEKEDVILATVMEHHSNFVPWQQLAKEKNAKFEIVDIDESGQLRILNSSRASVDARRGEAGQESRIRNAKIFAITYVSNMLGTINDLKSIIQKTRKINKDIIVVVDAAQAVPHKKVDVQALNCDFLVFSGHKMLAETGTGVLYGKKHLLEAMQPFFFGGDMIKEVTIEQTTFAPLPSKFEAGTLHIAGIVSLGAAIDYLDNIGMEKIQQHEQNLIAYCLEQMEQIEGLTLYGSSADKRCGLVSFNLKGVHAHDVAQILADQNICVRSGHHCTMPLHKRLGIPASVRASFYIYNDEQDVDRLINGVKKVKKIFK
ncbi:MAG TPA: SufS family cysteine desulfurase [Patescibacteria group bacterium]|nr:SufS family cysteine desulfurase [Patescibacteria group bacterium]